MSDTRTIALAAITIQTRDLDSVAVVDVSGEVDLVSGGPLLAIMAAQLSRRPLGLVVDLTGTVFFSAAGIEALVAAAAQARAHGIAMVVVADHRVVLRPLRITGVDRELRLWSTVDLALSALVARRTPSPALCHSPAAAM